MKKIFKTTVVVTLIYLIAIGATFLMSARVERLDANGNDSNMSVSLH